MFEKISTLYIVVILYSQTIMLSTLMVPLLATFLVYFCPLLNMYLVSCWIWAGEGDITEKGLDPIKVYSEKELIREIEKIASTLVPEKDWSIRIAAMQRFEALVLGGWCFPSPFHEYFTYFICLNPILIPPILSKYRQEHLSLYLTWGWCEGCLLRP